MTPEEIIQAAQREYLAYDKYGIFSFSKEELIEFINFVLQNGDK